MLPKMLQRITISFFPFPVHQWLLGDIALNAEGVSHYSLILLIGSGLPKVTNKVQLLTPAIAWANLDIAEHERLNIIPVTKNCPDSSVRNKLNASCMSTVFCVKQCHKYKQIRRVLLV